VGAGAWARPAVIGALSGPSAPPVVLGNSVGVLDVRLIGDTGRQLGRRRLSSGLRSERLGGGGRRRSCPVRSDPRLLR
jgi:hypothetical protein